MGGQPGEGGADDVSPLALHGSVGSGEGELMGWVLAIAATWVVLAVCAAVLVGGSIRLADREAGGSGRHDDPTPDPTNSTRRLRSARRDSARFFHVAAPEDRTEHPESA